MNLNLPIPSASTLPFFLAAAFFLGTVIVHVGFAAAVARDARQLSRERSGPLIAGSLLWTLATLLGGVYVAGLYWVVNHSALSRR
jgi:hypothetical protein